MTTPDTLKDFKDPHVDNKNPWYETENRVCFPYHERRSIGNKIFIFPPILLTTHSPSRIIIYSIFETVSVAGIIFNQRRYDHDDLKTAFGHV